MGAKSRRSNRWKRGGKVLHSVASRADGRGPGGRQESIARTREDAVRHAAGRHEQSWQGRRSAIIGAYSVGVNGTAL
jgi:hypothetical protein